MPLRLGLLVFILPAVLAAQTKSIDRKYVPIILKGYQMPLPSMVIDDWHAYRFDAVLDDWIAIRFQIYEVDAEGKYNKETDGRIDINDEILIMPEDLGDQAPLHKWIDDPGAQTASRIELAFTDTTDNGKVGWSYLFQHLSQTPTVAGYLDHSPPPAGTAADTIKSQAYQIGHNNDGWMDFVSLASNPKIDLVDRMKLRLKGDTPFGGIGPYAITEDSLNKDKTSYHHGLIRAFLDVETLLSVPQLWPTPFDVNYQLHYLPYSFAIGVKDAQLENPLILVAAGLKSLRQSFDLSASAAGMKFFSEKNLQGIPVDGNPDNPDVSLDQAGGRHWLMTSGSQGTIIMLLEMPTISGSTTSIYYRDSAAGGTNDGTPDTGDLRSYSDMGLWVSGNTLATDKITMNFTTYFLDQPNLDASFAQELFNWEEHPPVLTATEQTFSTSVKSPISGMPENFKLYPAYPNPFNPRQQSLQFIFEFSNPGLSYELSIYNMLGQKIAYWQNHSLSSGRQQLQWNGQTEDGRPAPPGVYFYRLQQGTKYQIRKLIIF